MTPADIKNIREIAERDDVLELLAKSLAPSIYGHDHIKKALVLQLLVSNSLPEEAITAPLAFSRKGESFSNLCVLQAKLFNRVRPQGIA